MEITSKSLDQKIADLQKLYKDYVETKVKTEDLTINYINSAFNCTNMINKIICLSTKIELSKSDNESTSNNTEVEEETNNETVEDTVEKSSGATENDTNEPATVDNHNEAEETLYGVKQQIKEEKEKLQNTISYFKNTSNELKSKYGNSESTISEEDKQARVDEYDRLMEKYANSTEEEIIHDELLSWKAKESWVGFRMLMNLRKAIKLSNNTINKESKAEDLFYYIGQASGKTTKQAMNNLETMVKKCDFNNPLFCGVLKAVIDKGYKVSAELVVRELIELYEDD